MATQHPPKTSSTLSFRTLTSRLDLHHVHVDEGLVSVEVENDAPQGETSLGIKKPTPRRSVLSENGLVNNTSWNGRSLFEVFDRTVEVYPERRCLGRQTPSPSPSPSPSPPSTPPGAADFGTMEWENYIKVRSRALNVGCGLARLGLVSGSHLGVVAGPLREATIMDLACLAFGIVSVFFHDRQPPSILHELIVHSEVTALAATLPVLRSLIPFLKSLPLLQRIILLGDAEQDLVDKVREQEKEFVTLSEVEAQGRLDPQEHHAAKGSELVSIVYSAGTTEPPKGVMLTNRNFLSVLGALEELVKHRHLPNLSKGDLYLSRHSHAFTIDRVFSFMVFSVGGGVAFFDSDRLLDELTFLKPTLAFFSPHDLCTLHSQLLGTLYKKTPAQGFAVDFVVKQKVKALRKGQDYKAFYDKLLFKSMRAAIGPRLRGLMVGDAPCPLHVLDFFRTTLECPLFEFYGLTESTGMCTVSRPFDYTARQVGPPLPCNEIVLVTDKGSKGALKGFPTGVGEVFVRGANMSHGYFKEEDREANELEQEGWVRTGDLGIWDERGRLRICGHRCNLIRLSTDDVVFPERLENLYSESKWVKQIFIYGEPEADFLVALVIPHQEHLEKWVRDHRIPGEGMHDWTRNAKVKDAIFKDLSKIAARELFQPLERLRDIVLHHEVFTTDNALLGPTGKVIRSKVKARHFALLKEAMEWNQRPSSS